MKKEMVSRIIGSLFNTLCPTQRWDTDETRF